MTRFARTRETPDWANPGSLLEGEAAFDFGWGGNTGLWNFLPSGAAAVVEAWRGSIGGRPARAPAPIVVIPPTSEPVPVNDVHEEVDLAVDWGGIFGGIAEQAATSYFAPDPVFTAGFAPLGGNINTVPATPVAVAAVPAMLSNSCGLDGQAWGGQAPPKGYKVVNYCGQGVLRKIRRRRRRRILSASDAADIATIVGLVGKGQMASSLINRRP